jgi:hypothetical protein
MAKGHFTVYDDPEAANTVITGISNSGDIVGYSFNPGDTVKNFTFRQDKPTLKVVATGCYLTDINTSKAMSGYVDKGESDQAIEQAGDKVENIGSWHTSKAMGVNDAGYVVGTYSDPHGFVFHNGDVLSFDVPGSDGKLGTMACGINNGGVVVGVFEDWSHGRDHAQLHGFLAVPKS